MAELQHLPALEINRSLLRRRTNKQETVGGLSVFIRFEFVATAKFDAALELRVQILQLLLFRRFGTAENYSALTQLKQVLLKIITLGLEEAFVNIVT